MVFCDIINKDLLEGVCKNMGKITKKTANRAKKNKLYEKAISIYDWRKQ